MSALEAQLLTAHPVLDQGFVRIIDYMGDDSAIVQAARVSYGKGTKTARDDAGLIRYLMRHSHTTPFEMCEIKLHVKMPIFVARQWIRHRTASVNEYSARYSVLDREFYVPAPEQLAAQSIDNKQGRDQLLGSAEAAQVLELLKANAAQAFDLYDGLTRSNGEALAHQEDVPDLARELARMTLPLSTYTQWYWKIDLHNLFHFLALRLDSHAQYEIRAYADCILDLMRLWVPQACAAFEEYRLGSFMLSATMLKVVQRWIDGEAVTQATSGLSVREWRDLCTTLKQRSGSAHEDALK